MIYLMLDKDDITNVCGKITTKELCKELNMSYSQLHRFVYFNSIFRDKYILIEDEKISKSHRKVDEDKTCIKTISFKDRLVFESDSGKKYYVSQNGKFFVVYKNGNKKYLKGYLKKHRNKEILCFKLGNKEFVAKNTVAKAFISDYKDGDVVMLKDGTDTRNVSLDNLKVIKKSEYSKITGAMSKSKKVALYENGKKVRTFSSARKVEKYLYISRQTACDICNSKVKKPMYDLRWV